MALNYIHLEQTDNHFDGYINLYYRQIISGEISPVLIRPKCPGKNNFPIDPDNRLLFAFDNDNVVGVASYYRFQSIQSLDEMLDAHFSEGCIFHDGEEVSHLKFSDIDGFNVYNDKSSLVELCSVESFQKGMGRKLVDEIRTKTNSELMMAWCFDDLIEFYEKINFFNSGITYLEPNAPIMLSINY